MEDDIEHLRSWSGYSRLSEVEQKALLDTTKEYAARPQPVEYGLSRYDFCQDGEAYPSPNDGLNYREEDRGSWWPWIVMLIVGFALYILLCFWLQHEGSLNLGNALTALIVIPMAIPVIVWLGAAAADLLALVSDIVEPFVGTYERRKPNADVLRYKEALRQHWLYRVATYDAELAVLRQKRSYWEGLNGYEFERATAEVLKRYEFNPRVTRGSGDGGIDIEVMRGGHKGVVQCKARASSIGPHAIRDLYGVIHHTSADFGMIVSRAGFTKGAVEFARNKPVFLIDTGDLIAMQEGRDVLGRAFVQCKT